MRRLTRERIDPEKVLASVADEGAGAVVLFLGTVRDNSDGRRVVGIEYDAYGPMAEGLLARTEAEVARRWPSVRSARIAHRVGRLGLGDVSVAIAVSSPHRKEAFEACRYAIEAIKHEVPIWKKEEMADGTAEWVEGNPIRRRGGKAGRSRRR